MCSRNVPNNYPVHPEMNPGATHGQKLIVKKLTLSQEKLTKCHQKLAKSPQEKSKICANFPNCYFGQKCKFLHPKCKFDENCKNAFCAFSHSQSAKTLNFTMVKSTQFIVKCKFGASCKFGEKCKFQHVKCKFGAKCQREDCAFWHSSQLEVKQEVAVKREIVAKIQ